MKQEGLMYFTDTWLTLIALIIFFSFFVSMSIIVMRVKKDYVDKMAELPLKENNL